MTQQTSVVDRFPRSENAVTRFVVELVVAAIGIVCLAIAIGANQAWLDQHFLPSFLWPRHWYTLFETSGRLGLATLGAWTLADARTRARRAAQRAPALTLNVGLAIALALGAAESALRHVSL